MRSDLRLTDLRRRDKGTSKLMNVKIPTHVSDAIQRVAKALGASKTEVVIALLNEGLDSSTGTLKGWKRPKAVLPPPKRVCSVRGLRPRLRREGLLCQPLSGGAARPTRLTRRLFRS